MKKLLTICLLITTVFTVNAQKLSGSLGTYSHNNIGNRYTNLNWEVSYIFEKRTNGIYLKYYNPRVTVAQNALYATAEKNYSKQELGLAAWPQNYSPSSLNVSVVITLPNGKVELSGFAFSTSDPYGTNEDWVCATTLNGQEINLSAFSLSVTKASYIPQSVEELDNIISQKKSQKTNTSNITAQNSSSNNPLDTSQTSTTQTNTQIPSLEEQYTKLGIPTNTPTYTKQEITNQLVTQTAGLVGGLLDEWNASFERKEARWKAEQKFKQESNAKNYEEKFKTEYLPLMDRALKGDEEAKMILYFTSDTEKCWDYVPLRWKWFEEALENNNTDALLEKAVKTFKDIMYKKEVKNDFIFYVKKAIDLGNVDAMILMASSYSSYTQTPNAKEAFELYTKAAENGSPIAMYKLGMIYKYGYSINATKYDKPYFAKFDVQLDEKEALEWFLKSYDTFLKPSYQESTFAKSIKYNEGGFFGPVANYDSLNGCFSELSLIYKKGNIVPKDKNKAKEYEILANAVYTKRNFQKFNLEWEN